MIKPILKTVVALIFVVFFSCEKTDDKESVSLEKQEEYCKDPSGVIDSEKARKMQEDYKNNQYKIINAFFREQIGNAEYSDNKSFWYSLEELECYFSFIKKEAKDKGYDPETMGVRVYLGAVKDDSIKEAYKTKLFFVPTGVKGKSLVKAQDNIEGGTVRNYGDTDGGDY